MLKEAWAIIVGAQKIRNHKVFELAPLNYYNLTIVIIIVIVNIIICYHAIIGWVSIE